MRRRTAIIAATKLVATILATEIMILPGYPPTDSLLVEKAAPACCMENDYCMQVNTTVYCVDAVYSQRNTLLLRSCMDASRAYCSWTRTKWYAWPGAGLL